MTIKGTNELRFNHETMEEIVEYYLTNRMFSVLGVGPVRVTDIEWLSGGNMFRVSFTPVPEKPQGEKKA